MHINFKEITKVAEREILYRNYGEPLYAWFDTVTPEVILELIERLEMKDKLIAELRYQIYLLENVKLQIQALI